MLYFNLKEKCILFFDSAVTYPNMHKEIRGFIKDINQISKMWRKQKSYYPKMKESIRKKLYMNWNEAVKKTIMPL